MNNIDTKMIMNSSKMKKDILVLKSLAKMNMEESKIEELYQLFIVYFVPANNKSQLEFLRNVLPEIKKHNLLDYESCNIFDFRTLTTDTDVITALVFRLTGLLVTAMMNGNEEAKRMLKSMYKLFYKKEYKQLERFNRISLLDALNFCGINNTEVKLLIESNEMVSFISNNDETLSRILFFSNLFGIEIELDCMPIIHELRIITKDIIENSTASEEQYAELDDKAMEIFKKNADAIVELSDTTIENFPDEYNTYKKNKEVREWGRYLKYKEYIKHCLYNCHINVDYFSNYNASYDENGKYLLIRNISLILLNFYDTSKEEELEEYLNLLSDKNSLTPYIVIMQIIHCFSGSITNVDDVMNILLDTDNEEKPNTEEEIEKNLEENVPENTEESLQEISRLKKMLKEKENIISGLENEIREQNKQISCHKAELENQEKLRNEVVHLRNYVYGLTEESFENTEEISVEEKEEYIKTKNIVIIGGHTNWTKKVRSRFPNWKLINPGPSSSVDIKIIDNADAIFFFTGILKHSVYNGYVARCRDKKLNYNYLSSISFNRLIEEIYKNCQ